MSRFFIFYISPTHACRWSARLARAAFFIHTRHRHAQPRRSTLG